MLESRTSSVWTSVRLPRSSALCLTKRMLGRNAAQTVNLNNAYLLQLLHSEYNADEVKLKVHPNTLPVQ